jgi:hypothetical protein
MPTRHRFAARALTLLLVASPLAGQSISIGVRGTGSIPTGSFADDQTAASSTVIAGAKNGFGYGLDAGLSFGPLGSTPDSTTCSSIARPRRARAMASTLCRV